MVVLVMIVWSSGPIAHGRLGYDRIQSSGPIANGRLGYDRMVFWTYCQWSSWL